MTRHGGTTTGSRHRPGRRSSSRSTRRSGWRCSPAWAELADEDPLVDLRLDEQAEAVIRLHGEVQKEVLAALMEDRYGVRVRFSGTLTACIERVAGTGTAEERVRNAATRTWPGWGWASRPHRPGTASGSGPDRAGRLPRRSSRPPRRAYGRAAAGPARLAGHRLHRHHDGVPLPAPAEPPAPEVRQVDLDGGGGLPQPAPVVVAAALRQAGTRVCQPIERFDVNLRHAVETALALLGRLGAVVHDTAVAGGYPEVSGTCRPPGCRASSPPCPTSPAARRS
ncbi:hypothetical protein V2I01_43275 [Micromonospora sp. BRA006-A]|nr:hypothetical protein [Micromonospora sp. BRA006-A]